MRSAIVSAIRIIALAAAALVLATFTASAQGWLSRPVTIIVPFPAGGTADLLTRGVAQALSDELGQQFVVDNRPGAGGTTGAAAVARAAPDGYTLLFASGSLAALNKFMFKNLPYDPTRDLVPVALVIKIPTTIVAGLDAPIGNFQDMVDYAKANRASSASDTRASDRWHTLRFSSCSRRRTSC
jgi:tripartite-type tricarboxylate transporter receptor subunit TctC